MSAISIMINKIYFVGHFIKVLTTYISQCRLRVGFKRLAYKNKNHQGVYTVIITVLPTIQI